MNTFQETMVMELDVVIVKLREAQRKITTNDIHGAQARVNRFYSESIACPKTETGYVR